MTSSLLFRTFSVDKGLISNTLVRFLTFDADSAAGGGGGGFFAVDIFLVKEARLLTDSSVDAIGNNMQVYTCRCEEEYPIERTALAGNDITISLFFLSIC